MGVKHLWDIIDEAKSRETLDCLRGKVLCVDLSIWIVEAIKTLQFKTSILKPHLRNMFFRILCLRRLGVKLLFVTEGDAPELKQETMKRRNEIRYGVKSTTKSKVGRSRFQRTINECCRLLDILGIPYVRAAGEAEAMCAVLNKHGLVDGCFTNDGDFFLYGGQVVYRDLGIDPKDPHVLKYTLQAIKSRTRLSQNDMIGLALINGCDYTKGIAGVGKITITKFLEEKSFSDDLIQRFKNWYRNDFFQEAKDVGRNELVIARKALKTENFFNQKIIDEYLIEKDALDGIKKKLRWKYPDIKSLQQFLLDNLEWPFEYTLPKALQLATSTYLEKLADSTFYDVPISPSHVMKTRCQQGVSLVEIEWKMDVNENLTYSKKWENCPESFVTLENQQVVVKMLPGMVEVFVEMKKGKGTKKTRKDKTVKPTKNSDKRDQQILSEEARSLDDVDELCDRLKTLAPHEVSKDASLESSCSEDSESDVVLPLSQRLSKKAVSDVTSSTITKRESKKNQAGENVKNFREGVTEDICESKVNLESPKRYEFGLKPSSKLRKEDETVFYKNLTTRECVTKCIIQPDEENSPSQVKTHAKEHNSIIANLAAFHIKETPTKDDKNGTLVKILSTPLCFDVDTPPIESTPCANSLKPSVSVKKKISSAFKDITNFSELGDSILCDSLELCVNDETSSTETFKENQRIENGLVHESFVCGEVDDSLSPENSPMCLADRLKLKQASIRS